MVLTTHTAGAVATAAVVLPALGFAAGSALFERAPVLWTPVGPVSDFPDDDYLPRVITITQGIGEVGKTTVYVRRYNPKIDDAVQARPDRRADRRDLQPLHAPRLPRPLDVRPRRASSARATAASTASRARSTAARRCARSTTSTRGSATARSRSVRATRSTPSSSASRAIRDPGQPLDGIGQYLYPGRFSTPKNS